MEEHGGKLNLRNISFSLDQLKLQFVVMITKATCMGQMERLCVRMTESNAIPKSIQEFVARPENQCSAALHIIPRKLDHFFLLFLPLKLVYILRKIKD